MAPANGARKKASWAEALADSLEFNLQNVHISYDHTPAGGEGVVLSVLLKSFSAKSDETLAEDTAGNKTLKLEGTLQACDLLPPLPPTPARCRTPLSLRRRAVPRCRTLPLDTRLIGVARRPNVVGSAGWWQRSRGLRRCARHCEQRWRDGATCAGKQRRATWALGVDSSGAAAHTTVPHPGPLRLAADGRGGGGRGQHHRGRLRPAWGHTARARVGCHSDAGARPCPPPAAALLPCARRGLGAA